MYKHETRICCDICQAELTLMSSEYYNSGTNLDILCEQKGWACICVTDPISLPGPDKIYVKHICPECIRIVGYAHSYGLTEIALKKFDPQTYSRTNELTWRIGNSYFTYKELVFMTHEEEKNDNYSD